MEITTEAMAAYVRYIEARTGGDLDRDTLKATFGFSDDSPELEELLRVIEQVLSIA